jgi:hypothetical protein
VNPTEFDVLKTLAENSGLYVEFMYYPLPECQAKKNKNTPSAKAAKADTIQVGDNPFRFAGYLLTMRRGGAFAITKADNLTLTMRSTTRRKKLETGVGYYADKSNKQETGGHKVGFSKGEHQYRAFRLDRRADCGLDLSSVRITQGGKNGCKGLQLFPNVAPLVHAMVHPAVAEVVRVPVPAVGF